MSSLKGALWIDSTASSGAVFVRQVQSICASRNLVLQPEDGGVWVITNSAHVLTELATQLMQEISEPCRVLLTLGELSEVDGKWVGWSLDRVRNLKGTVDLGQVWFTAGLAYVLDLDQYLWEDLGLISVEEQSVHCYRMLTSTQCFVPSALRRAIQSNKCVMVSPNEPNVAVRKGQHIVFVGFEMNDDLMTRAEKALMQIANDKIWLVSPKVSVDNRRIWHDMGRHLVVGTAQNFKAKLLSGGTIVESNATLFLDPVGNVAGELDLVGIAIPKVPMAKIIDGYSIDLLETGEWGFDEVNRVLTVSVSLSGLFITTYKENCRLNSRGMTVGQPYELGMAARLSVGHKTLRYIGGVGRPYEGIFIGEATQRLALNIGSRTEVGRQPTGYGMVMQERGGLERLTWSTNPQAQRAKAQALTIDRALTGRQHAAITVLDKRHFIVQSLHDKLPTFAFSARDNRLHRILGEETIKGESLLVIGTNLLQLG